MCLHSKLSLRSRVRNWLHRVANPRPAQEPTVQVQTDRESTESPAPVPEDTCLISRVYLPEDVLYIVVQDEYLDLDDFAALRLTNKTFNAVATPRLFHRIRISQLHRDRDTFLEICNAPHLAKYVREIEWQEVSWCSGLFAHACRSLYEPVVPRLQISNDGCEEFSDMLDTWIEKLFWLPKINHDDFRSNDGGNTENQVVDPRQDIVDSFRKIFYSALAQLPHLHTAISRPMNPSRIINQDEYPVAVKFLQSHRFPGHPRFRSRSPPQSNDGLFLFLLPAIECNALPVKRLLWDDEGAQGLLGPSYCRKPQPTALQNLTALSLVLGEGAPNQHNELAPFLNAANNVRDLSLETKRILPMDPPPEGRRYPSLVFPMMRMSPEGNQTAWSHLRSLSLTSMPGVRDVIYTVVEHNAETLKHLHVCNCSLQLSLIEELSTIQNLKLKSVRFEELYIDYALLICEEDMLSFINKDTAGIRSDSQLFRLDMFGERIITTVGEERVSHSGSYFLSTCSDDRQSVCSVTASEDSREYRCRTGPFWLWGRYFHNGRPEIFCHQVPQLPSADGARTTVWKFTSRDNEVAYGDDPYDWFEEWDTEAGDVEEPTPYGPKLYWFSKLYSDWHMTYLGRYVGFGSPAWGRLRSIKPPEGAFRYDSVTAELVDQLTAWQYEL